MGRARDLELAKHYRTLTCSIADKYCHGNSEGVRIKNRGGGEDCHENLWPLCRLHSVEFKNKGIGGIIRDYPKLKNILIAKGWEECKFTKKWIRLSPQGWDA